MKEQKVSLIYDVPLEVKGYVCIICNKWHRKGSKIFFEHCDRFDENNKYIVQGSIIDKVEFK